MTYIKRGTPMFRSASLALFAGGFSTFAILWGMQPLLPEISGEFHISPALSSLSLSAATVALSISLLIAGSLSEVFGRKNMMAVSLVLSAILSILTAFAPNFHTLILARVLQGITLAGLPAAAMAYLGEEMDSSGLGLAMGLYISGNSIGGMAGRIVSGILTDAFSWHAAMAGLGIMSLLASIIFWKGLPDSRHFKPRELKIRNLVRSLGSQFRERSLLQLFLIGFLIMGGFVALYNYMGFQLTRPPYSLSQTLVGFIFIVYIVGSFSSTWMGMLSDIFGKSRILLLSLVILLGGACLTLSGDLSLKILGLAIFTYGFFAAHSIASGWVGLVSTHDKAQAASLYLFFYYAGASIGGTGSGILYSRFGWPGVISMIAVLTSAALVLTIQIGHRGRQGLRKSA
ncbi:MFS transporter [Peribacillus sp. SCS-37]|uniref:MFS transporter n=1 Tax=Paraperibacillus esterisolvens TaxID=3115296 RepID=UPI0039064599